jgi:hypothetical protein
MRVKQEKPYWSTSVKIGAGPEMVYAWERLDRGGRVFVKYAGPKPGRDRRGKYKLDGNHIVRDARGRLDKRKIREVLSAVSDLAAKLHLGQPTRSDRGMATDDLTLHDGFALLLDHATGKFPTPTRRWDEVRRAQTKLERILGAHRTWLSIVPADARKVWRELASKAEKAGDGTGARQAEVTVDAMYSTANWLRAEGRIPMTAALSVPRWRTQLREDWERITGHAIEADRQRHEPGDMRKLFNSAHDPRVDPRLGLAFDLGGEQRLGQVLRSWRSDLRLTIIALDAIEVAVPGELGMLMVRGSGKKKTSPIVLTAQQRAAVDAALDGYLFDYENAYRAGTIANYPLFPAGRFKKGKAKIAPAPKPIQRDGARKMFLKLEKAAGVEHVRGRGWYGVRRVAADLAEDDTKDERVLNSITGHRDSATRREYQDPERFEILRRAAETRDRVRRGDGDSEPKLANGTAGA